MSNHIKKVLLVALCVLGLSLSSDLTAYADGTTMIYLSEKDIGVGDTFEMKVNGSEKSTITVRYNASILNFTNCDAAGYTTNGNAITFSGKSATITFKATAEGKSNLIVASDKLTGASTAVNVGAGSSSSQSNNEESNDSSQAANDSNQAANGAETEQDNAEASTNNNDEGNSTDAQASSSQPADGGDFSYNGVAYVVSERFKDSEVPAGFTKKTVEIHGSSYNEPVNDTMTLLYLKPASNTSGSGEFYVYDTENDSVSPMQLLGDNEHYVILMPPGSLLQKNMVEAEISVGDKTCKGYRIGDVENDFYFVYGMNESQTVDWYQYDAATGTIQRVNTELFSIADDSEDEGEGDGSETEGEGDDSKSKESFFEMLQSKLGNVRLVLALLIFVLAVLIIVIIDLLVFRRNDDDDEVFGDDEGDDDGDIELIGTDKDGLLDVDEVRLEDDSASEPSNGVDAGEASKSKKNGTKQASAKAEDEEDDEEDDDDGDVKQKKKRPLFFRKKKQDDIWSEPDASENSLFDDEDEYEKFFRRVRSNSDNASDGERVDVIDLNDL